MVELTENEQYLIEILRCFDFLKINGYSEKRLFLEGRELPSVVYENIQNAREVHVIGNEQDWSVKVIRTDYVSIGKISYCFDIKDFYSYFGCCMSSEKKYSLKSQADFIKQHLLPVIKGDVWIFRKENEVIFKKEKKYLRKSYLKVVIGNILLLLMLLVIVFYFGGMI